jgi:M6 family metalloprotease-like protein
MKSHLHPVLFTFLFFISIPSFAAHYNGEEFLFSQPDGNKVKVRVFGDEFYQRVESIDGYTLIRDAAGWICYAAKNNKNSLESTGIVYENELAEITFRKQANKRLSGDFSTTPEKHISPEKNEILRIRNSNTLILNRNSKVNHQTSNLRTASQPLNNVKGLTLLIEFSDEPAQINKETIERFFNEKGFSDYGNNGSVRDFFNDVSGGYITYTNHVVSYYKARKPKSYYDDKSSFGHVHELLNEALIWLDDQGFDFSTLTTENGMIKAVNVMYAGQPSYGWCKGLWPHMSYHYFEADGVSTGAYQMTYIGQSLSLGTTCHENGHMLFGWPDLYDYDYNSYGAGNYCLMSYFGNPLNPLPPNAYLRQLAGWENPQVLNNRKGSFLLKPGQSFVYRNPENQQELFVIEGRTKTGRNKDLPDEGLMIWHVDEYGINSFEQRTYQSHYKVSLEQADGLYELEKNSSSGGPGDLFKPDFRTKFSDFTLPDARWWNGQKSGLNISQISGPGENISFTVGESVAVLNAPQQLRAVAISETEVKISWEDKSWQESGFAVERSTINGNFELISQLPENSGFYLDRQLSPDSTYHYRIYSYTSSERSDYSEEVYITVHPSKNIALNKPVFVSSVENTNTPGKFAADGDTNTRWASRFAEPEWIYFDLQKVYSITTVNINWEKASALNFNLQSSADGINWTTVRSVTNNISLSCKITDLSFSARFVRIEAVNRTTPWGFSIYEVEIFGEPYSSPVVKLISPAANAESELYSGVLIEAEASDKEGFITRVDFYNDDHLIGSSNSRPFEIQWQYTTPGIYNIHCVAYNNQGLTSVSEKIPLKIFTRPSVTISLPDTANLFTPASLSISAEAEDTDGFINKVEFFQCQNGINIKLGEDRFEPYNFLLSQLQKGNYTVFTKSTDNEGRSSVSEKLTFTVLFNSEPSVTISADTSKGLFAPSEILLSADAYDTDGIAKSVNFYQDNKLIATDSTFPFQLKKELNEAGAYKFSAVTIDNHGLKSAPSDITILLKDTSTNCYKTSTAEINNWAIRNSWSDQLNGSYLGTENESLKITQRAWGKNELWLTESSQKSIIEKGAEFEISFEFRNFPGHPVSAVEAGLAGDIEWHGPVLLQPAVRTSGQFSADSFTTIRIRIKAEQQSATRLAIKLIWKDQPAVISSGFIRNVKVCRLKKSETPEETTLPEISVSPNPAEDWIILETKEATKPIGSLQLTDMLGVTVYSGIYNPSDDNNKNVNIRHLPAGMYMLYLTTSDGTVRTGKFLKE